MTIVIALIVAGVVLLAAEVFVPGAILGIAGGLFMLGGVVTAFVQFGAGVGTTAALISLLLLAIALYLEFKVLPRSRFANAFSMTDTVAGAATKTPSADLVGCECVAVTQLLPSGVVLVEGKRHEAFCRSGSAGVGARLRVVAVDNFRLVVTHIETPS